MEHILHLNSSILLWSVWDDYCPHSTNYRSDRRYAESHSQCEASPEIPHPNHNHHQPPQCSPDLTNQKTVLWQVTNQRHQSNFLRLGSIMGHFRLASPTVTPAHNTSVFITKNQDKNKKVWVKWLQNPFVSIDSVYSELITHHLRARPGQS